VEILNSFLNYYSIIYIIFLESFYYLFIYIISILTILSLLLIKIAITRKKCKQTWVWNLRNEKSFCFNASWV